MISTSPPAKEFPNPPFNTRFPPCEPEPLERRRIPPEPSDVEPDSRRRAEPSWKEEPTDIKISPEEDLDVPVVKIRLPDREPVPEDIWRDPD